MTLLFALLSAVALKVIAQEEGSVEYCDVLINRFFRLSDDAFDKVLCEKFADIFSPEAQVFERKVEEEFDRCNLDIKCTQMGIMALIGEVQSNSALYKEVSIVLAALGRNKLRNVDGTRRFFLPPNANKVVTKDRITYEWTNTPDKDAKQ